MAPDPQLVPRTLAQVQNLQSQLNTLLSAPLPNGFAAWNVTTNLAGQQTAGTYTWTCPAGVTAIQVQCWGAGGGGSGGTPSEGGGGGGGGAYAIVTSYPVTPGNTYMYIVGKGGGGGTTGNPGQAGTASSFDITGTNGGISAGGGTGATGTNGGAGASQASGAAAYGFATFPGGNGAGDGTQSTGGCGGGGAAGNSVSGANGSKSASGTGGAGGGGGMTGGGTGGAGGAAAGAGSNGVSVSGPGGGGGGGGAATAAGQVTHAYSPTLSGTWNGSDATGGGANQLANSTPSDGTLHQSGVSGNPGTLYGTQKAGMILPASVASDLTGVTIDRVTLVLNCLTTYGASAIAKLGYATFGASIGSYWSGTSPAITALASFTVSPGTITTDLTSTGLGAALKSGAATALTLGLAPALSTAYRCSFTGAGGGASAPMLTVTGHTGAAQAPGGTGADGTVSITYQTTGGANELIASCVAQEGTDPYGNWMIPGGITVYGQDLFSFTGYIALQLNGNQVQWYKAPATMTGSSSPWSSEAAIWWDESGVNIQNPAGPVTIEAIGGTISLTTTSQWQAITLDSGWSTVAGYAAPSYQLLPDGNLQLTGVADWGSVSTANHTLNNSHPLPAAYRPSTQKVFRASDQGTGRGAVQITSGGVITMLASSSYPGRYCELDTVLPLNL